MSKYFIMKASFSTNLSCTVKTPDDWTEEDVRKYYKYAGADGQFEEDPMGDWTWDDANELDETPASDEVGDDLTEMEKH